MKDFVNKFLKKKKISEGILRKIDKKTFVMFSRFWPLRRGGGEGVWESNPLKKENSKQRNKKLVAVSYNFSQKYLLKT